MRTYWLGGEPLSFNESYSARRGGGRRISDAMWSYRTRIAEQLALQDTESYEGRKLGEIYENDRPLEITFDFYVSPWVWFHNACLYWKKAGFFTSKDERTHWCASPEAARMICDAANAGKLGMATKDVTNYIKALEDACQRYWDVDDKLNVRVVGEKHLWCPQPPNDHKDCITRITVTPRNIQPVDFALLEEEEGLPQRMLRFNMELENHD